VASLAARGVRILEQLGVFQKGLIKAMVLSILLEQPTGTICDTSN
jgi:hypothetical protein